MKPWSAVLLFVLAVVLIFPQAVNSEAGDYAWSQMTLPTGLTIQSVSNFAVHPQDAKTAFMASSAGLYKTTNAGVSWTLLSTPSEYIFDITIAPGNPQRMFIRSWQIHRSDNGGSSWTVINPPGSNCGLWAAPSDANRVYALSCANGSISLAKSTNAGQSWVSFATPFTGSVDTLVIAPNNPDILVVTTFSEAYRSTNGGQSWVAIPFGTRYFGRPVFDPRPPYTLYLGHWTGLLRSDDCGQTWEDSGTDREFSYLVVSPIDSTQVLGGNTTSSWQLTTKGAVWSADTWNAPQPLNGLWRSATDSSVLYARTSTAFWRYQPSGQTLDSLIYLPAVSRSQGGDYISPAAQIALERANLYRQRVNILPLSLHPAIVAATQNHANYFLQNHANNAAMANGAHGEVAGYPGYTGDWPGDRMKAAGFPWFGGSEVMHFIGNPTASVDGWMATIYHRVIMLDPGAHYTGYGMGNNGSAAVDVMDFGSGPVSEGIWQGALPFPLAYPANGQTDVPTTWGGGESPDPLPPGASRPVGYPFTLQGVGGELQVSAIEMRDNSGRPVTIHPNAPDCGTFNCYAVIPVQPLQPNSTYTIHALGNVKGTPFDRQWTFTTGAGAQYSPALDVPEESIIGPAVQAEQ